MVIDSAYLFSSSYELLQDVCQFTVALDNTILAMNETEFWQDKMDSYNELRKEEIKMYKYYEC